MGKKYIHCTCGQDLTFTVTAAPTQAKTPEIAKVTKAITVKGKAWVYDSTLGYAPPVGITEVTDEDLAILEEDPIFQSLKSNGYVTIRDYDHQELDAKGVATGMQKKDNTSQILDSDHANGTDDRIGHNDTRATYGDGNQYGGKQPASVETSDFGPIRVA